MDTSLEIRAADAEAAEPLCVERLALIEERGATFERFGAVVDGREPKGGDPALVPGYRTYMSAVAIQETSRWTWNDFTDSVLTWFFSLEGGGRLGVSLAIIVASFSALLVVARITRGWTRRVLSRVPSISMLLRGFLFTAVHWLTRAFGLMIVLAFLGVNITPLFALVGGASFITAFALQDTLGNRAAGLMIMINHPFDEGDFVSVGGASGTVGSVSIVSTTVATPDNRVIVSPNSRVWGDVITNNGATGTRRVDLTFGVSYDDSIEEAQEILEQVAADHPLVLRDPAPVIGVNQLSANSVDFIMQPWVRSENYLTVHRDLTRAVKEAFDARGITIPFPQNDMHVRFADGTPVARGSSRLAGVAEDTGAATRTSACPACRHASRRFASCGGYSPAFSAARHRQTCAGSVVPVKGHRAWPASFARCPGSWRARRDTAASVAESPGPGCAVAKGRVSASKLGSVPATAGSGRDLPPLSGPVAVAVGTCVGVCGSQDLHRAPETRRAACLGTENGLLFAASVDARGALFETWYKMIVMLEIGMDVRPVVAERVPAAIFLPAFETMRGGAPGKVVRDWSQGVSRPPLR